MVTIEDWVPMKTMSEEQKLDLLNRIGDILGLVIVGVEHGVVDLETGEHQPVENAALKFKTISGEQLFDVRVFKGATIEGACDKAFEAFWDIAGQLDKLLGSLDGL